MQTVIASRSKTVVIDRDGPFVIIGERLNPTGRQKLAEDLCSLRMDVVRREALAQVEAGADALDVNAGIPGADEARLLAEAVRAVMGAVDVPLCIDSSSAEALEAGLAVCEGKPLVNSVTGEEASLSRVLPLVKKHGAAVIGLTTDERGILNHPGERLRIARKILQRAADYSIPPEDVIIDPLALPVGGGPRRGVVTLESIRLLATELKVNVSVGASNVSFGLPNRLALNAAFLPLAMGAGLSCALTNPLVSETRRAILAADLLLGKEGAPARWLEHHRK
ncbi:MAG: dihydropteroate synthase [Acidobacteria bacterium]|nr:dihydropteroate synthase [Acidobacteriota bacterium]